MGIPAHSLSDCGIVDHWLSTASLSQFDGTEIRLTAESRSAHRKCFPHGAPDFAVSGF